MMHTIPARFETIHSKGLGQSDRAGLDWKALRLRANGCTIDKSLFSAVHPIHGTMTCSTHVRACRRAAARFGFSEGGSAPVGHWIPSGRSQTVRTVGVYIA